MVFRHNSAGVNPEASKFQVYPEGEYSVSIVDTAEKKTDSGFDMVELKLQIIEHEKLHGKTFKHWIVFIPAGQDGDGISVHFRKCIGVPYGGDDEVDANSWVGKKLRVKLKIDTKPYKNKKTGITYTDPRNKVAAVMPYGADFPEVEEEISFP